MARVPQMPVIMLESKPRIRVMEKPCSGPEPMAYRTTALIRVVMLASKMVLNAER